MDQEAFRRRRGRIYAAVTPRELWKASGHRAGSRERSDKADLWRSLRLQLAIVVFAAVIMPSVLLGTILNHQGGTKGTPVFPWEWARDQPKDQPARPWRPSGRRSSAKVGPDQMRETPAGSSALRWPTRHGAPGGYLRVMRPAFWAAY